MTHSFFQTRTPKLKPFKCSLSVLFNWFNPSQTFNMFSSVEASLWWKSIRNSINLSVIYTLEHKRDSNVNRSSSLFRTCFTATITFDLTTSDKPTSSCRHGDTSSRSVVHLDLFRIKHCNLCILWCDWSVVNVWHLLSELEYFQSGSGRWMTMRCVVIFSNISAVFVRFWKSSKHTISSECLVWSVTKCR